MVGRPLFLLLAALAAGALSPAAAAAQSDAASTRAYVQADYALARYGASHIGRARTTLHQVLRQVEGECPQAAAGSPQDSDSTEVSEEVIGTMVTSIYRSDVQAIDAFVRSTQHLRWGSRSVTNAVRSYVGKLKVMGSLTVPRLCADVRAWAAAGYATLPADTLHFDAQFEPNWVSLGELPPQLVSAAPHEDASLIGRSKALEQQIAEFEAEAAETWRELMNALDVEP